MDLESDAPAAPSSRPVALLTPDEDRRYKLQLQGFEKQLEQAQIDFHTSEHTIYYLVSTEFLETWRAFCLSN